MSDYPQADQGPGSASIGAVSGLLFPTKGSDVGVVKIPDVIACAFIFANIVNMFFSSLGVLPDLLLLSVAVPAFVWTLSTGFDSRRIRPYLVIVALLFLLYFLYSASVFSYRGFRNAASIFTVTSTFLFFFRAAPSLVRSTPFLVALCVGFASFMLLVGSPSANKNVVNGAMCYYLIGMFFCLVRLDKIKSHHVAALFFLIFCVSLMNGHRTLAGSSILLLLQYYALSLNVFRAPLRNLMFIGLVAVIVGTTMLLVDPNMSAIVQNLNDMVTGEGGRRLNSGREVVWPTVWQAIIANPVLGMGPGTVPGDLYFTTLSSHNLYLQLGLQIGYVGFALIALLFWSLWYAARPVGPGYTRPLENLMTVVITMVVVHSLFAVFLLQNALVVGVPVWMMLGLGLGNLVRQARDARLASLASRMGVTFDPGAAPPTAAGTRI